MAVEGFHRLGLVLCATVLSACSSVPVANPANVSIGAATRSPMLAAADAAPPQVLAIRLSSEAPVRGSQWSGQVLTTSNVASVEVRTNLFSIDVPRRAYGDFRFSVYLVDVPPIFIRAYRLRVIARNSAGVATEEDLPLRIR